MRTDDQTTNHHFPPESAGRLMVFRVPAVLPSATIGDIEKILLQKTKDFESINYVYILNEAKNLVGVISIKEIFRQPKSTPVSAVMIKEIVFARPHSDREKVAYLALKNNLKAIPIIDKNNEFLGVVLSDAILQTLYEEGREDIFRLAGVHKNAAVFDNVLKLPILRSLKHRFPWLLLGLIGGVVAAKIIGFFEPILKENLILAAFIPLIVYMADAVGTQMEVFIIRDLAFNPALNFFKYLYRQLLIIFFIGSLVSITLFLVSLILYKELAISFVLAIALFIAVFSSVITGLLIPYLFGKFKLDPANASGPIATIIQDILSVMVYFLAASLLL